MNVFYVEHNSNSFRIKIAKKSGWHLQQAVFLKRLITIMLEKMWALKC